MFDSTDTQSQSIYALNIMLLSFTTIFSFTLKMSQQSHCVWRKTPKGEQLSARAFSFLQDTTHAPSGCTASLTSSWSTWAGAKPRCVWRRQYRAALCPGSSWAQRCPSAAGSTLTRLRCCSATRTWALSWKSSATVKSWIAWRWVRSQEVSAQLEAFWVVTCSFLRQGTPCHLYHVMICSLDGLDMLVLECVLPQFSLFTGFQNGLGWQGP